MQRVSAGREFSRKGERVIDSRASRTTIAKASSEKIGLFPSGPIYPLSTPPPPPPSAVSRGELALPFRVATSRFSRQGAVFGRLLTDSTGSSQSLVPRMAARRASVRSAVRSQRRGDFVMKNFRLASGSACQAWSRTSRRTGAQRALSLFPTAAVCFYGSARLTPTRRGRPGNRREEAGRIPRGAPCTTCRVCVLTKQRNYRR